MSPGLIVQRDVANIMQPYFAPDGLVTKCLDHAADLEHIMDFTRLRALGSLFSMLNQNVRNVIVYNNNHPDFPMQVSAVFYLGENMPLWLRFLRSVAPKTVRGTVSGTNGFRS